MNIGSALDVLNRFLIYGFEKGIFQAIQVHILKEYRAGVVFSPPTGMGMIENGGISPDEYLCILEEGRYSAVFDDGAIIYLECKFEGERLVDHRYFFIPCPFATETITSKPDHFALADWLKDSLELEPRNCVRSKGVFRFDCVRAPTQGAEPHPISHLTFAAGGCRIPIRGPLQISSYFNFIFDNFYRDYRPLWLSFSSYLKFDESETTITGDEQMLHHLHWELQP